MEQTGPVELELIEDEKKFPDMRWKGYAEGWNRWNTRLRKPDLAEITEAFP